jgi:hypothetical protein
MVPGISPVGGDRNKREIEIVCLSLTTIGEALPQIRDGACLA